MSRSSFVGVALLASALTAPVLADGTEQLGPFAGLVAANHIAAAGVGLDAGQPGTIELALPADATVRQVLLYWEGLDWTATDHGNTATAVLDGVLVFGDRIGGSTDLFGASWSSTFRADVTALAVVGAGANSVQVGGLDFTRHQQGAGLVALYDLPGSTTRVLLADGDDVANHLNPAPSDTTAPVTFALEPSAVAQQVELTLSFAPFFDERASVIVIESEGQQLELLLDVITQTDGASWCTLRHTVTVPAGLDSLTVRALAVDSLQGPNKWMGEQKFVWMMAALTRPGAEETEHGGLTPGFWKNHKECWDGKGCELTDTIKAQASFNATFGVSSSKSGVSSSTSLIEAAGLGGGGLKALARHAAAALANADAGIGYPLDLDEVIDLYQDTVYGKPGAHSVEALKDLFEEANEIGFEFEGGKPCGCDDKGGKDKDKGKGKGKGKGNDGPKKCGKGVKLLGKLLAKLKKAKC